MLPSDVQLMASPEGVEVRPDLISKTFSEVGAGLSGELLDRLRRYITTARSGEFSLTEQVMKAVQDDFVSMRQTDQGITMEQFHSLLVLGRLGELKELCIFIRSIFHLQFQFPCHTVGAP